MKVGRKVGIYWSFLDSLTFNFLLKENPLIVYVRMYAIIFPMEIYGIGDKGGLH
jgi:hypothetical protein